MQNIHKVSDIAYIFLKGGNMLNKQKYVVSSYFNKDGISIQETVRKYFVIFFREELEKLENFNEL